MPASASELAQDAAALVRPPSLCANAFSASDTNFPPQAPSLIGELGMVLLR
jgi:hypothetical protein